MLVIGIPDGATRGAGEGQGYYLFFFYSIIDIYCIYYLLFSC